MGRISIEPSRVLLNDRGSTATERNRHLPRGVMNKMLHMWIIVTEES